MAGDTTTWQDRTFVPFREATQKEADDPEAPSFGPFDIKE